MERKCLSQSSMKEFFRAHVEGCQTIILSKKKEGKRLNWWFTTKCDVQKLESLRDFKGGEFTVVD